MFTAHTAPKLTAWQYCYAMVCASKNSPLWRKEHAAHWGTFRSYVICIVLILSLFGFAVPFFAFSLGSIAFFTDISQAVFQQDIAAIMNTLIALGVFVASVLAWVVWFQMALSWFEMERLGVVLPIAGTALALVPAIYYGIWSIVFSLPSIVLACFLCVWHTVGDKRFAPKT